ncbi:MAG: hypothetical protein ABI382_11840 [Nakamurella sp.]
MSATHAHSTPETSGITTITDSATLTWASTVPGLAADTAAAAFSDCSPAHLVNRKSMVPGIARIRRMRVGNLPSFAPDESLSMVIAHRGGRKKPIVLMNFACHPVLLQARPVVSSDFPGYAVASLDRIGIFGLFIQGAAGDVNPLSDEWGNVEQVQSDADLLSFAVADAVNSTATSTEVVSGGPVAAVQIELPLAKRSMVRSTSQGASEDSFERPDDDFDGLGQRLGNAHEQLRIPLQFIRIGAAGLVAIPGEPVTALGALIKAMSPAPLTLIGGCCNDYYGYLVPPWDWIDGGYEVGYGPWSLVAGESTLTIVTAAVAGLNKLWAAPISAGVQ